MAKEKEIKEITIVSPVLSLTKESEINEIISTVPLLRPPKEKEKSLKIKAPPKHTWQTLKDKILSGEGIDHADRKRMSKGDWVSYDKLIKEIQVRSEKSGARNVVEDEAAKISKAGGEVFDKAAEVHFQYKEHIDSTVDDMENFAFIITLVAPEVAAGLEGVAKAVKTTSRILSLRSEGKTTKEIGYELAYSMGKKKLESLPSKAVKKSLRLGGFSKKDTDKIYDRATRIVDTWDKVQELKKK